MSDRYRRLPFFLMAEWPPYDDELSHYIYICFAERVIAVGQKNSGRDAVGALVAASEMVEKWGSMLEHEQSSWLRPFVDQLADADGGDVERAALAAYAARHDGDAPAIGMFGVPWHLGVTRR